MLMLRLTTRSGHHGCQGAKSQTGNNRGHVVEGGKAMNGTFRKLSAVALAFAVSTAIFLAHSHAEGKARANGKQTIEVKGKHGREAGKLPFGLERHIDEKGGLPSGLQKKKDEKGSLTRGLEEGGKSVTSAPKAKKRVK
jgi:hypothetical protein